MSGLCAQLLCQKEKNSKQTNNNNKTRTQILFVDKENHECVAPNTKGWAWGMAWIWLHLRPSANHLLPFLCLIFLLLLLTHNCQGMWSRPLVGSSRPFIAVRKNLWYSYRGLPGFSYAWPGSGWTWEFIQITQEARGCLLDAVILGYKMNLLHALHSFGVLGSEPHLSLSQLHFKEIKGNSSLCVVLYTKVIFFFFKGSILSDSILEYRADSMYKYRYYIYWVESTLVRSLFQRNISNKSSQIEMFGCEMELRILFLLTQYSSVWLFLWCWLGNQFNAAKETNFRKLIKFKLKVFNGPASSSFSSPIYCLDFKGLKGQHDKAT